MSAPCSSNSCTFSGSPLHTAMTEDGKLEIAHLLLGYPADADVQDRQDSTPLHAASGVGYFEYVKSLLERGADPNARTKDNILCTWPL